MTIVANIASTTNPLQVTFTGILIAIAFLVSIVGVLGWMLRLPKETERTRSARVAVRSVNRISRRILKARNAGAAIVREAEEQAVDLILIARTSVRVRGNMQQVNPAIDYVMKNAPCEVLVLSPGYSVAASNGGGARETERTATTV